MGTTKVDIPISQLLYEFLEMVGFMMTVADFPSILWSVRCVVLFLFDIYNYTCACAQAFIYVDLWYAIEWKFCLTESTMSSGQ